MKLKSKDLSSPPSSGGILTPSTFRSNSIPSYPYSRSNLENGSSYFGAQIFTYAELVEATHNFDRSRELGDGGYGTVYSGKDVKLLLGVLSVLVHFDSCTYFGSRTFKSPCL